MFKKLVRSDGVLYRIMHLLADETGTSWVYSADNTEVLGYRHEMKLGVGAAQHLLPTLSHGAVLKGYHPKHVRSSEDEDDPLSFPAFRVKLHQQQNDGESFAWDDAWEMLRDIQEIVTNVLSWANIPAQPDPTTFVADDHFDVQESEFDVERFSDPTPGLEAEQEHVLLSVLDDLTPSGKAVARHLATDGGSHVAEIADKEGYSIRQIYRAVEHMGDAVELDNGQVQFVSEKLRQEVQAIAERMENAVESWATRAAEIVDLELRQSADSALEKWLAKYGAEIEPPEGDDPGRIRFDTVLSTMRSHDVPRLSDVLAEGLDAWMSAGRNPQTFREFRYAAEDVLSGDDVGKVNPNLR
jgi:hypothetical protein